MNLVHLTIEQGEKASKLMGDYDKQLFLYGYARRRLSSWITEESFNASNLIEASKALATADYELKQAGFYFKELENVSEASEDFIEQTMEFAKIATVSAGRAITLVHDYMSGIFD